MKKLIVLCVLLLVSCQNDSIETEALDTNETLVSESRDAIGFESDTLEAFYEELFVDLLALEPAYIDSIGDLSDYGVAFQKDRLTIRDDAYYQKLSDLLEAGLSKLESFEIEEDQKIDVDNVKYYLEVQLESIHFKQQEFFLGFITGEHRELYDLLLEIHTIENKKDAEDWIARVWQSEELMSHWMKRYQTQLDSGYFLDDVNIDYTLSALRNMYSYKIEAMDLYKRFERDVKLLDILESEKTVLIEEGYQALNESFVPSVKAFAEFLNGTKQSTIPQGVYHMPEGEAYYEYALKKHTTTDMTAEEIHQLGLNEVKRIQSDLISNLESLGYEGDLSQMLNDMIRDNPIYRGDDAMNRYLAVASEMEDGLETLFYKEDLPVSSPDIRKSPGGNFYVTPSIDGKRSGVYYLDLNGGHPEFAINTLAYHETVPGHHLEREHELLLDMPLVRKLAFNTAYIEGWALYAEMLADEYGYNDTPEKHIGYLKSELHRAARLVVDTGLHYKKWDRQQAVDYLVDEGLLDPGYAQQEVTRYMSWPGQATAYKIGQLKLLELRNEMETRQGENFDIKEFHHRVLSNGSMPLTLLERYFDSLN